MKRHGNAWHCPAALAVLASCGLGIVAGAGPEVKEAPRPVPPEAVKAWRDAGAAVGWMIDVPPRMRICAPAPGSPLF